MDELPVDKEHLLIAWDKEEENQCRQRMGLKYEGTIECKCPKCKYPIYICYDYEIQRYYKRSGQFHALEKIYKNMGELLLDMQHIDLVEAQENPHPRPEKENLYDWFCPSQEDEMAFLQKIQKKSPLPPS
jgi:phage FluMu protein Com